MKKLTCYCCLILCLLSHAWATSTLTNRHDVRSFIANLVEHDHFDAKTLHDVFQQVHILPTVLAAIKKPYETVAWYRYEKIFLIASRIEHGINYAHIYQHLLSEVSAKYGVPPEIIVAVIGVETDFGRHRGKFRVIDALSTLAFDYPPRAKFFMSELTAFLLMSREQHLDPLKIIGSYAGAIGLPQFMPSSYRLFAVDYNHDGSSDLQNDNIDAIASIGNYLFKKGWERNAPVAVPAKVTGSAYQSLLTKVLKPEHSLAFWAEHGVQAVGSTHLPPLTKATLIDLETAPGTHEYWLGFQNFYVITRYNPSPLYAMAVMQLGEKILAGH